MTDFNITTHANLLNGYWFGTSDVREMEKCFSRAKLNAVLLMSAPLIASPCNNKKKTGNESLAHTAQYLCLFGSNPNVKTVLYVNHLRFI